MLILIHEKLFRGSAGRRCARIVSGRQVRHIVMSKNARRQDKGTIYVPRKMDQVRFTVSRDDIAKPVPEARTNMSHWI